MELSPHMSTQDVEMMCPPGAQIKFDANDSGLRVSYRGLSRSKAFAKWTPEGAAQQLINITWTYAIENGFELEAPFEIEPTY